MSIMNDIIKHEKGLSKRQINGLSISEDQKFVGYSLAKKQLSEENVYYISILHYQ